LKVEKLETQTIKNRDLKNRLSELRELRKLKNTRLSILYSLLKIAAQPHNFQFKKLSTPSKFADDCGAAA